MYDQRSLRRYQETDVSSMGKEKLITLLYEKMVTCLQQAEQALARDDRVAMAQRVNLAQRIVTELRNALDHAVSEDIAGNLESIYEFIFHENLQVLVDRDPRHLANGIRVLQPLLDAWRQIPPGTAERAVRERDQAHRQRTSGPDPASDEEPHAPELAPQRLEDRREALTSPARGEGCEAGLLSVSA